MNPLLDIHLFHVVCRVTNGLRVAVDIPVTGLVVVDASWDDVHDYIQRRAAQLAKERLQLFAIHQPEVYKSWLVTPMLAQFFRDQYGLKMPPAPDASLRHSSPSTACAACQAAQAATVTPEAWQQMLTDTHRMRYIRPQGGMDEVFLHQMDRVLIGWGIV